MHLKTSLVFLLLFVYAHAVNANPTNEEIFTNALKEYDAVLEKNKKIKGDNEKADEGKKITREQYKELKVSIDNAIDLFDQYLRVGGSEDAKKASRHYMLVLKQVLFSYRNDLGEFKDNFAAIPSVEADLAIINSYYYPLKYTNKGKNYVIEYDKRIGIEKTLLVEFAETSTNLGKSTETVKYAKRAYSFYNFGDYNLWWCAHLWYYHANKQYYTGAEMLEPAEKVIYAMSGMKRSDIKKVKDSNWVNYTHAYNKINTLLASTPSLSKNGQVWANAGDAFVKLDEEKWASEYYSKALKDGYGDRAFLIKMMERGKSKADKTLTKTAVEIYDAKNLYLISGCTDYSYIADYFEYVGNTAKATELKTKTKECEKKRTKEERRQARGGKFLVSFAPLPLLSRNLQASIQMGGNKRLHEFGIRLVNKQRDYGLDMLSQDNKTPNNMVWSGIAYYYTYKKFITDRYASSKTKRYIGIQLRYTSKEYEQQFADVQNAKTNISLGNRGFNPNETRYDFTLQIGNLFLSKHTHFEIYYGAGIGYSIFDGGNSVWNNDDFKITNNVFLSERKEARLGLSLRMGIKMGLNFLNK